MIAALPTVQFVGLLIVAGLCVLASAFFSGTETGLYCVNRLRLRLAAHEDNRAARSLQGMLADQASMLFISLIGNNIVTFIAPMSVTILFLSAGLPDARAELYTTLILTPVIFVFGEIVPKNLFQRHADRLMPKAAPLMWLNYTLFRLIGLIWLRKAIEAFIARHFQRQASPEAAMHPRQAMYQMLREGAAEGALSATQIVMLERIRGLQSLVVGSHMISRTDTVMVSADASRRDVERIIGSTHHSRLPVYRGDKRTVIGVVHVLDLLTGAADTPVGRHMRTSVNVAYDTPLMEALGKLQDERRRMATVVDNRGRCLGIVTVKDLIEEVIGELAAW